MRLLTIIALLLGLSGASMAIASNHEGHAKPKCACTKECKENCEKGKKHDCKCTECECAHGHQCAAIDHVPQSAQKHFVS